MTTTYSYDPKSTRLTGITTMDGMPSIIQNTAYQYTPGGDIDSIVDYHNNSTFEYFYDNLHRLIEEKTNSAITATYTYNHIGNITSKSMGTDDFNYTLYHPSHKHAVETISLNGTPYDYTYDGNGNMTSGPDFTDTSLVGTRTISYNADNMPTQVTSVRGGDSTTVNYGYDGFGRRYKKEVVGGMTTYYLGDHFEIKGGTPVKYIFAGNLRVAQVEGTTLTYLHKDHLGSSSVMTDSSGFETESTQYMPYGSTRPGSGEITGTSYKYTDQEFDTENGLYNYDARLYDPVIGRFISPDTIIPKPFNPQSLNRYIYCLNNPLIYVDPSGHWYRYSGDKRDEHRSNFDLLFYHYLLEETLYRYSSLNVIYYYVSGGGGDWISFCQIHRCGPTESDRVEENRAPEVEDIGDQLIDAVKNNFMGIRYPQDKSEEKIGIGYDVDGNIEFIDCSHLVNEAFKELGIEIAFSNTTALYNNENLNLTPVTDQPQAGDIMLWYDPETKKGHMAFYDPNPPTPGYTALGATTSKGVRYGKPSWFTDYYGVEPIYYRYTPTPQQSEDNK